MRRSALVGGLAALMLSTCGSPAQAAPASWRLEQPPPPPPPAGINGVNRPLGLGPVGDIKFYSPNRGLLISGGNPPAIPKGVWAYDGAGWHLLSTVCGSGSGRIAWSGPDEFWTVSDAAPNSEEAGLGAVTLCHFVGGAVVGSYATPVGSDDPYVQMTAAACNSPSDCWFGGIDASPPVTGAFHLHWDGSNLSDVLGPQDRPIESLASLQGQFFESAFATNQDTPVPAESLPALLHRIVEGVTPSQQFVAEPFVAASDPTVPSFLTLGTDGNELWAVGGQSSDVRRAPFAARFMGGTFQELGIDTGPFPAPAAFLGVAPEPGAGDAWVTAGSPLAGPGQPTNESPPFPAAQVARVADDGTTREVDTVPAPGSGQVAHGSAAGPIACPAANDCWLVTKEGWLFHYTDGSPRPVDTDPDFVRLIDVRPPDAGTATLPPDSSPLDDSLANQPIVYVHPLPTKVVRSKKHLKPRPLAAHVSEHLHGTTLQLGFTLAVKARVELSGVRGRRTVARTGIHVLARGRHVLRLQLNIRRWPTRLKFSIVPVKA